MLIPYETHCTNLMDVLEQSIIAAFMQVVPLMAILSNQEPRSFELCIYTFLVLLFINNLIVRFKRSQMMIFARNHSFCMMPYSAYIDNDMAKGFSSNHTLIARLLSSRADMSESSGLWIRRPESIFPPALRFHHPVVFTWSSDGKLIAICKMLLNGPLIWDVTVYKCPDDYSDFAPVWGLHQALRPSSNL